MGVIQVAGPKTEVEKVEQSIDQSNIAITETDNKQPLNVVFDGPLSQTFTDALNLAYAKEEESMMANLYVYNKMNEQQAADKKDLYVYCCDSNDLDQENLVESTDKLRLALDQNKYKEVMVVAESHGQMSSKLGLLERFSSGLGAKVYLSTNSGLEAIKTVLKG